MPSDLRTYSTGLDLPAPPGRTAPHVTVYVVDDQPAICDALSEWGAARGWTVRPYTSPATFLAEFDPDAGGCLLLDWQLPSWNVYALLQEIQRRAPGFPVLIITGSQDLAPIRRQTGTLIQGVLEKPFDTTDLLACLKPLLHLD